ncbi:MAG: TIGR01777 family protein [Candidatus Protochlamydia sp.]|nr:TIGR01777 family protein [Candidatus Protochlamydia sp.]
MKILISGSSGLVGSALVDFLKVQHHHVYRLVRTKENLGPNEISWNPDQGLVHPEALENFDAVVHLAGENIAGKWTEGKKKEISESRVKGTQSLCVTLSQLQHPPEVLISASAIGYYGNRGNENLTESSCAGEGFLADVCKKWEEAAEPATAKGIRTVLLRTGMVLSPKGGALKNMVPPFKLCMGGKFGPGSQYISWISIDDLIGIIDFALMQKTLSGPLNAVTPYPVTNQEFTDTLGRVLHRPTFLNVPAPILKLIFGQMAEELLLGSQKVIPAALVKKSFCFKYPQLDIALKHLLT